jgi:hypothetical protein
MKIVFVNRYFHPDHSATSQLLSDLAFHLAKAQSEIYVVTSRQVYDDPASLLPKRDSIQGVVVIRVWTTRYGVSQLRPRVVFVGIRKDLASGFSWPEPLKTEPPTVGELLHDLMKANGWRGADRWREQANTIAPTLGGVMATVENCSRKYGQRWTNWLSSMNVRRAYRART